MMSSREGSNWTENSCLARAWSSR
uniref:Uncharacterized protein n=1 Tax=Anguilla anguilla TaxID=7936 RepID=A0A0E9W194_ANGAN